MKYGLDTLFPPSPERAARMKMAGWTFCVVYVGGPRAASGTEWQQVDGWRYPVKAIAPFFTDGFLPIYVGKNQPWDISTSFTYEAGKVDGDQASNQIGACGFDRPAPLALDLEHGTYQANPVAVSEYVRGWVEVVNAAGHRAGLYSDIDTLNAYENRPDLIDFLWGAAWVKTTFTFAPVGQFDPRTPPPWDIWQFGRGVVANTSVDCNSAADSFAFAKYSSTS